MVCANWVVATVPDEESLASSDRASKSASHSDVHRFKYLQWAPSQATGDSTVESVCQSSTDSTDVKANREGHKMQPCRGTVDRFEQVATSQDAASKQSDEELCKCHLD